MRFCLVLSLLFQLVTFSARAENTVLSVDKYQPEVAQEFSKLLKGQVDYVFGSGLAYKKTNRRKEAIFYTVSDRPVIDQTRSVGLPLIATLVLKAEGLFFDQLLPTVFDSSATWLESFRSIPVDIEGVAPAPDSTLWLADETGPSLIKLHSKTGLILDRVLPGDGLPELLAKRQDNRGIEGVSVFPNSDVLLAMQSIVLESKNLPNYIILVRYNPTKRSSTTFAYPVDFEKYADPLDVRLGGLQVISENQALIIEHGPSQQTGKNLASINYINFPENIENSVQLVEKQTLLDLKDYAWPYLKPEGIALFNGGYSLAVSNDPDDIEPQALWVFNFEESLIPWSIKEWIIFSILTALAIVAFGFSLYILVVLLLPGVSKKVG